MTRDEGYINLAMTLAAEAAASGETPVGAVVVKGNEVVARACNSTEADQNATRHAELKAIELASKTLGAWRLSDCELFVTMEPCAMCSGAILNARLRRVVFGAFDPRAGCLGSVCDMSLMPMSHRPEVLGGVLETACKQQLSDFFAAVRKQREKR